MTDIIEVSGNETQDIIIDKNVSLYEQVVLDKPRIDKDKGIIYHAKVLGLKSANGYEYDAKAAQEVTPLWEEMVVGIDHDYNSTPLKADKTWGTLHNPTFDEHGVWADLSYKKSHPLTEQILEDLGRPDLRHYSLSSVNTAIVQKGKIVTSFRPSRCDLVVRGATTKTLLEQEITMEDMKIEEKVVTYEQYNDILTKYNDLLNKVSDLEVRLTKYNEYIAPKTNLEQRIVDVTKGIDLQSFWKD